MDVWFDEIQELHAVVDVAPELQAVTNVVMSPPAHTPCAIVGVVYAGAPPSRGVGVHPLLLPDVVPELLPLLLPLLEPLEDPLLLPLLDAPLLPPLLPLLDEPPSSLEPDDEEDEQAMASAVTGTASDRTRKRFMGAP